MEQRPFGSHGGTSGGVRPPLPTAGTPAKTRRRTFFTPVPTSNPSNSGLPHRQEVPNSVLPCHQELLYLGGAPGHNPLTATFTEPDSPPLGATNCWDTRNTSSSPAVMEYVATGTSEPIFDSTQGYSADVCIFPNFLAQLCHATSYT